MREIALTKGYVACVDDEDYERLNQFKWCANEAKRKDGSIKNVYGVRTIRTNGKRTVQHMHRFILGITDPATKVDHEDHNGLNNQRYNLRPATDADNNRNARVRKDSYSGLKGVTWDKGTQKWRARIKLDGKRKSLGYFVSAKQAACAYDLAALQLHGAFAYTNTMAAQEAAA